MRRAYIYLLLFVLFTVCSCENSESGIQFNLKMEKLDPVVPCTDYLDEPYGVCAHITREYTDYPYIDGILDVMDSLNITWVRSDMDWTSVSSKPGQMNYTFFDKVFAHMSKHPKIHLLPIITPENSIYTNNEYPKIAIKTHHDAWLEYVEGLITRYQDQCPVWEGFNEWDRLLENERVNYQEGVAYQKEIYEIAKKVNPDLKVVEGSVLIDSIYQRLAFRDYYKYSDFSNSHLYSTAAPEDNSVTLTDRWATFYQKRGNPKEVWITETGYSTARGFRTEEEQAFYIPRVYISGLARGLDKIFLYSLRSREYDGHEDDKESHFGIVHKDLSPKPAYYSMRSLTRMLPSGSSRPKLYKFKTIYLSSWEHPELGRIYAIWNNGETKTVGLEFQGTPHCYSYMDIDKELDIQNYGKFQIGPGIIYITGATALRFI